ncbi:MAG: hypothetical protein QOG04_1757 [Actinomycetota bacterium]|jgi:hypothetical protein|nr:hypothetical protein [Actinomycetota bacterium]
MRRGIAVFAAVAAVFAMAIPAGAKTASKAHTTFALSGEARALELAIGDQGVSLGVALSRADSTPSSIGVGAGQCTLLGSQADPDNVPCNEASTVKSRFPGLPGTDVLKCAGALPEPLASVVDLGLACGSSKSGQTNGVAYTRSTGKVAHLGITLPVGTVLDALPVKPLVNDLTAALSPVLDLTPDVVHDAVDNVVGLVTDLAETEALAIDLGPSTSSITNKNGVITVDSASAGALIGLVGIPEARVDGTAISATSDPLKNGLVIIEVGTSRASASLNEGTASAAGAASAAIVTIKVRDITQPEPTYVEQSIAPGQTVTVLAGTPAETTIVAADSTIEENGNSAAAAADAVSIHALKGVNGGVRLALARSTAAVKGDVVKPAAPIVKKAPPQALAYTGGTDLTIPALALILGAGLVLVLRRKVTA